MQFDKSGFGRRLKEYRKKKGWTQEQLAEVMNTTPGSVSHLENGTHSPSLNMLISLCEALGIGVDALLADSLPSVKGDYLDADLAGLFSDCTTLEKEIIKEIVITTKKALREHK